MTKTKCDEHRAFFFWVCRWSAATSGVQFNYMFKNAVKFNQPVDFLQVGVGIPSSSVVSTSYMFEHARDHEKSLNANAGNNCEYFIARRSVSCIRQFLLSCA